jgi:predicted nucleotidyltransferase
VVKVNAPIIDTVQRFLAKLSEQGIHIDSAYLFGSYAKGTENRWSDIDVAIISSDITDDRLEERIRFSKLSSDIDTRKEPVPFRPDTFVDEDPLAWEIKKEGILIEPTSYTKHA